MEDFLFFPLFLLLCCPDKKRKNNAKKKTQSEKKGGEMNASLLIYEVLLKSFAYIRGLWCHAFLCESLGYQCTASDRETLINKLSVFPPVGFFSLKWELPLLKATSPSLSLSLPLALPLSRVSLILLASCRRWQESQVCGNNYTYTQRNNAISLHLIS